MLPITRRALALGAGAFSGLCLAARTGHAAPRLVPTPASTEGPFYPRQFPVDVDADLVQVAGRADKAKGVITYLQGRLVAEDGRPVPAAAIEIWQCDAMGVYHHVGAASRGADPNFQGFGKAVTAADGGFRFRTIKPAAYPGRTPHIHVKVMATGHPALTAQLYVAGEPRNERDGLYRAATRRGGIDNSVMHFSAAAGAEPGAMVAATRIVLAAA